MKVGIVVDSWNAPIFRTALTEQAFEFEEEKEDKKMKCVVFAVYTDRILQLQVLVRKCQEEARKRKDELN